MKTSKTKRAGRKPTTRKPPRTADKDGTKASLVKRATALMSRMKPADVAALVRVYQNHLDVEAGRCPDPSHTLTADQLHDAILLMDNADHVARPDAGDLAIYIDNHGDNKDACEALVALLPIAMRVLKRKKSK